MRRSRSADAPGENQGEHTDGTTKLQLSAAPEDAARCEQDSESDTEDESSNSFDAAVSEGK